MRQPMSRGAVLATVFILVSSLASIGVADETGGADEPALRLEAAEYRPANGESPDIPDRLRSSGIPAGRVGNFVVQFDGPITEADRAALEAAGAAVVSYLPDFAYKISMTNSQAAATAELDGVVHVGAYEPAFRLSSSLDAAADGLFQVTVDQGRQAADSLAAVLATGAVVASTRGRVLVVDATLDQLEQIARIDGISWIENRLFPELHNEYGAGAIMGADAANASGYDGSTQVVAVADTGIGDGTASGVHADVPVGRVTAVFDWPSSDAPGCFRAFPDGARDVDSGHGTHTALSVVSDGGPGGIGKGTAPAASLVFQAVEDYIQTGRTCASSPNGYYLTGLPDDLTDLFQQAYDVGARVHSNSWGSSVAGDYTADSATVDLFTWNNPDMLITTSAGNSGIDANANGVVDDDSIGSPATAKNVLTVGASENDRAGDWSCDSGLTYVNPNTGMSCSSQGGVNDLFTYGEAWPGDFPTNPIASDPSAGDVEQMAAFSSRGPTDDGRIKPDVVAPGTWVLSGYSSLYQEGYGDPSNPQNGAFQYDGWGFPVDDEYKYMGGTSMSNPLAAGAAVVVRDYYQKEFGHNASAALAKASLINSAVDLADENNDGVDDNDFPIPNMHEGWGRVDVGAAVDGTAQWVDDGVGLSTGGSALHQFTVDAGSAFKVSLVWSDFPSDEAAAINLVNDLDLVVTAPDGTTYIGNNFSGGWTSAGAVGADRLNNVENVYVPTAGAGTWTVAVSGFNVPFGPQPFALVVDGQFDGAPPIDDPPTVTVSAPTAGATVSGVVTTTADATDDNGVTEVEFSVNGAVIGTDTNGSDGWSATWDTTGTTDGAATVIAVATDTAAQTASDSVNVTVDNDPGGGEPTTMHVADLDGVSNPSGNRWTATVTVSVVDDEGGAVDNAGVTFEYLRGSRLVTTSCTTDATGSCSATTRRMATAVQDLVTMTVIDATHATLSYDPGANTDPDGDSDGTSITIVQ